jgi:putative N6-adenine-specific DNA methylase
MTSPFEKRIRRHVVGKSHRFFAVTAPGLEPLCRGELESMGLTGAAVEGGVEFSGRLQAAYRANLCLRTANRILLRMHEFRATNFRALTQEAASVPWELFIAPSAALRIHVTTHHCRLHHSDAIAERVQNAMTECLSKFSAAEARMPQQIFIRGVDDRFTVSLDSSGENLYRRGIKTHAGTAPLRETLAAAALLLAGYSGEEFLLDPMCGAGTFALEAALVAKHLPPGGHRDFAFMAWPGFRPPHWDFLKRTADAQVIRLATPRIMASDNDPHACRALEECVGRHGLADAVSVSCRDFFDIDPRDLTDRPGLVTLNPPYGRRLGSSAQHAMLLRNVFQVLQEKYRGWKAVVIAPHTNAKIDVPFPAHVKHFFHGGLTVNVVVAEIPSDR